MLDCYFSLDYYDHIFPHKNGAQNRSRRHNIHWGAGLRRGSHHYQWLCRVFHDHFVAPRLLQATRPLLPRVAFTMLFNFLYTLSLKFLNPFGKPQAIISETVLARKHNACAGDHDIVVSTRIKLVKTNLRALRSKGGYANPYENDSRRREEHPKFLEHVMRIFDPGEDNTNRMFSQPTFAREWLEGNIGPKRGMILPFKVLSLSFVDLQYFMPTPLEMRAQGVKDEKLQLLCGVTGAFRPGVLTALLGVSGVGKTTFMDVLAGRKTGGEIQGEIHIFGFVKSQATFACVASYCEQNNIHSPQVMVRESFIFSSWLRLPSQIPALACNSWRR